MEIKEAFVFGKNITPGEPPAPPTPPGVNIAWNWVPPGYIDGDTDVLFKSRDNRHPSGLQMGRGLGRYYAGGSTAYHGNPPLAVQHATDDFGRNVTALTDDVEFWEQYIEEHYETYGGLLFTIPFYNVSTREQSPYHIRVFLNLDNKSRDYWTLRFILYNNNSLTGVSIMSYMTGSSVYSYAGISSSDVKSCKLYCFAGSGKYWSDFQAKSDISNLVYCGIIARLETNSGELWFHTMSGALDLEFIKSTYNIEIDPEFFRGNNDNPDYPIVT